MSWTLVTEELPLSLGKLVLEAFRGPLSPCQAFTEPAPCDQCVNHVTRVWAEDIEPHPPAGRAHTAWLTSAGSGTQHSRLWHKPLHCSHCTNKN